MNKEIHFFDLDGTLWKIHSDIWVVDKEKPYKPVIKISSSEFSLIKNGIYKNDDIPLEFNGSKFFISKNLWAKISKRSRSENKERFGISFNNFYDKKELNKSQVDYLMDNISHLRGKKNISIGLLTARSNMKTHSDVVNKLRLELKNMGIHLDKLYFVGDKFKVEHDDKASLKKVYVLLEHLIGFKIKNNRFVPLRQDWFNKVHFYDDHKMNIDYANDCQRILNDLIKNTDDEIHNIIIERINTNDLLLYNYLVTNNEVNRFEMNVVDLQEPDKYPIRMEEKRLNNFDNFIFVNESKKTNKYYKVVTEDLKSLGLRKNPTIMTFPENVWVDEPNPTEGLGGWGGTGGIWVANSLSAGKGLLKYMKKKSIKENVPKFSKCRLFEVEIGNILYSNSYRTKTDKVKLIREVL